jgi:hypothetical protein
MYGGVRISLTNLMVLLAVLATIIQLVETQLSSDTGDQKKLQ